MDILTVAPVFRPVADAGDRAAPAAEPAPEELAPARVPGAPRFGIRPPKFAGKFAELDFESQPMPVISMFTPPGEQALADIRLAVRGDDLKTRVLGWADLATLPVHGATADMVCQIFNWHESVTWAGFLLRDVLAACGVAPAEDGYLKVASADGEYFETLSLDHARDPRTLLAFGMNGGALPHQHGGPLRLVVPFLQGYKSVKWVDRLEVYKHDPVGIKRLLGQSKTARLGQAWLDRLAIAPPTGRPSDPA